MKKIYAIAILAATAGLLASCQGNPDNENLRAAEPPPATRSAHKPVNAVYIEVKDINPLNAGSYFYEDGTPYYDIVIIFAANINGVGGEAVLHFNNDITHLMADTEKYIRPLQEKGIKVVLNILGNHTGLGFANLNDWQIESFAQKLAWAADHFGLDGIDFSDSWAKYGENGYPYANSTSYGKLVKELRRLMPDKLITMFDWGYSGYINGEAAEALDYAWSGLFSNFMFTTRPNIPSLPTAKFAGMTMDVKNMSRLYNNYYMLNAMRTINEGYGGILNYDLRDRDVSEYLTIIGQNSYGQPVYHDGNFYVRDWSWGPTTNY